MKTPTKRVPGLRFKGFDGDWEQRKLGQLATKFDYGLNAAAGNFDGKHKYLRITDIDDTSRMFLQNNLTSPITDYSELTNYILKAGDVVFARTGASTGKTYKYRDEDGLSYFAGFLIRASVSQKSDVDFFYQATLTESFLRFIQITSQRSGQPGINSKEYANYEFMVPHKEEQKQIGMLLKRIDIIIALHERKLDLLKELKKAYLQQLFPKNGDKTPQLRFAGFTDDWEQRKLGEVTNHLKSYPLSRNVETSKNSGYRYIHYGDIHTRVADIIKNEAVLPKILLGKYDTIKTGDLCLADASEDYQDIAAPSVLLAEHTDNIVAGLHTIALRPKSVKPLFLYYVFKAPDFRHYVYREGQGLKVFGISASNVFKYKYVFPSVTEQADIIKLLSNLDCAIALHERRLGQLNNLKQAFLQKLYV